jgi:alpha-L-rhamnosidase
MNRTLLLTIALLFITFLGNAQLNTINPDLLKKQWPANWISCPGISQREYGVYHFRKSFSLDKKPDHYIIHISADNRYRLWVNGTAVCSGPARGDLYNWYFETVDLSTYLQQGRNTIAVQVWNLAIYAPTAQVSSRTGLIVQGDEAAQAMVNTDETWKVVKDEAYTPCALEDGSYHREVGAGDHVNGSAYPWDWQQVNYPDEKWLTATSSYNGLTFGNGSGNMWIMEPRTIPLMEERLQRIPVVRRAAGIANNADFLTGKKALTIPANQKVSILIDQTFNTVAYPELITSNGKGALVKITYAEALKDTAEEKGNRNEIEGRTIMGTYDEYEPDGGHNRLFRPLWFRTYRYMQLDITTKDEPLVIEDLYGRYTGYPFEEKGSFSSNDTSLKKIWEVGWRTARLCAGETYFDCPYYEQLQYIGDTRIQALVSLYVAGDDRLMRKAINDFYNSRVPEGLTQSRYPSTELQIIPPFSLFWVSMIHDYYMHRKDDAFIKKYLLGITGVLDWYEKNIDQKKQMLGPMKWWNFADWNTAFEGGRPDGADDGNSSVITLQYAYTLQQAATLFNHFGKPEMAAHYTALANSLTAHTYQLCFNPAKNEMANTPAKNKFSQHAGIMGVLTGAIPAAKVKLVMQQILHDTSLSQATFYYRFYLTQALKKANMADMYYSQLKPWRDMLAIGLTTFAENPEPSRSDCHAWSASPDYDFLATICGIMPGSASFATVKIQPALGELTTVNGSMPHPLGNIVVSLKRKGPGGIEGVVTLPAGLNGSFVWKTKTITLKSGLQNIDIN